MNGNRSTRKKMKLNASKNWKRIAALFQLVLVTGCYTGVPEIERDDIFDKNSSFIYGYAEDIGGSRFELMMESVEEKKKYTFTRNWVGVPFYKHHVLMAFKVNPGKWKLGYFTALGSNPITGNVGSLGQTIEAKPGKAIYIGCYKEYYFAVWKKEKWDKLKPEVDERMKERYPNFDSSKTEVAEFVKTW
jgi:hypothetical protein